MSLDADSGIQLIRKAQEEARDEKLYLQWLVQLPWMTKESFISFDAYREQATGANIDTRPTSEIMAELDDVENELRGGTD